MRHNLAGREPIEQVADRGQMLFDGRRRERLLLPLDPRRDMQRPHSSNRCHTGRRAPSQETCGSVHIRGSRAWVADVRREKINEPNARLIARSHDQRRYSNAAAYRKLRRGSSLK